MKRKLLAMVLAVSMTCGVTAGSSMIGFAEETEVVTEAATEALTDDAEAAEITADPADEDYYPVTVEVYNNARELVPYTFEKCPEKTLVYGRNNVEIMLALGLGDKIEMITDCGSVKPEMVIGWYSLFNMEDRMGDVDFWHERNIGTYTSINSVLKDNQSLENEYADIRNIATIYNKQAEAEKIISEIEEGVEKGKKAAEGKDPQRILIAEKWEGEYDI